MSEKKEAGLSEIDMQAVIAACIVVNDGCSGSHGHIYCNGSGGVFNGTPCPLKLKHAGICPGTSAKQRAVLAREWLEKYHQQRVEAAETEKREAESAKKQEQEAKQKPKKICGNCKYIHEVEKSENMTAQCDMKNSMVPILFDRCPDFAPRTSVNSEAAAYLSRIANITQLADTEERKEMQGEAGCRWVFRLSAALPPDVSVSDVICAFMASAPRRKSSACAASPDAERIAHLEKENAELQSTNKHLRKELAWQFEQIIDKVGTLQDQNAKLREKLDAATKEKNSAGSRLVEHLKQMEQRVKDLEREAGERSWPPRPRFFL